MKIISHIPRRSRRVTLAIVLLWGAVFPSARIEAGSLVIPAWSFVRGNVQIDADPNGYADAGPVVISGPKQPWGWTVEYDIDVPATANYTLQVCYASAEARPIDVSVDDRDPDKCCTGVTFALSPSGQPEQLTSNSSGAKWDGLCKYRSLSHLELPLDKGIHTVKLASRTPLPHLVALRLDTPTEFPTDWKSPPYEVQDLTSIPAEFHKAFLPDGDSYVDQRPVQELPESRVAGSLEIPACTFDRGNIQIYASPDNHADAGPMAGGGPTAPDTGVVEYDINVPVTAEYTIQIRYAAAEARPTDVWFDDRRVGRGCNGITIGSSRFEVPVRFSWSSRTAKWEQLCDQGKLVNLSITKGKHTLKLTRRGPLPHLLSLRLNTPAAFPKDWKQPERKVDLTRVPPRYRSVFLPVDAANAGALRLAVADTMKRFGAQYPDGKEHLKKLSELEVKKQAIGNYNAEAEQANAKELTALRSKILHSHPELNFDKLLFLRRASKGYGHTYSDQHSGDMGSSLCILSPVGPDGKVTELIPELNGGLFDRFDLSYDAKKLAFSYRKKEKASYRIYEIDLNPSTRLMVQGSLRQLTFGGGDENARAIRRNKGRVLRIGEEYDDMDPCYLPDGRIMFTSTRAMQIVFCAPGATVTSLYSIDRDGQNLRRLSESPVNETAPSVLNDGRVIYTRWEYVDKGLGNGQSLWAIRPDGTGVDHFYKNNITWPAAMSSARGIPGSPQIVTVAGGHHFAAVGPVVLVDTRRGRRTTEAMNCITPEVGYPTSMGYPKSKFGTFMDPYPLSEKFFLVSHGLSEKHKSDKQEGYALYALDAWGNRTEIYRDPELSCFEPFPLRPRQKPTAIDTLDEAEAETELATLFMQDVYEGMKGIERGRVKYVRVMGALPWPWDQHGISWRLGMNADPHRKKIYGVAKVHKDGSSHFSVPPGENLFFQALDEDFMALQQMATFVNLRAGEQRSCIGCHEGRTQAPDMARNRVMAMNHPPQTLVPQPGDTGPRMIHYASDVQPILDKHCISCHSGEKPTARLNLTGEPTAKWNRSHESLIKNRLVSYADCRYGSSNFVAVPPLSRGSHRSKLSAQLRKDPCKGNITREEYIRIVTWIDANVPYYGTYRGKRDLRDKDDPEFRLAPLAIEASYRSPPK